MSNGVDIDCYVCKLEYIRDDTNKSCSVRPKECTMVNGSGKCI